MQIDVRQQRRDHRALRRADHGVRHGPFEHHPGTQPAANQPEHARITYAPLYQLHQQVVVNRVEVALEIEVNHLVVAVGHPFADVVDRLPCAAFRPEPIRTRPETRLEQRFDDDAYRGLCRAILDPWDAQRSLPPIGLGNEHAPDRLWPVALFEQFHLKLTEELLHSLRFDGLDGLAVDPRCTAIATHLLPRYPQYFPTADLVVQYSKRPLRLCLGRSV